MNTIFESEDREEQQDSEVTLSTGTLLAIFFGLVVVCGVFFGFGYSMGRRSYDAKAAAAQAAAPATAETTVPVTSRPKPSALEVLPAPAQEASTPSDSNAQRTAGQPGEPGTGARSIAALSREQTVIPRPKPALRLNAALPPATEPRPSPTVPARSAAQAQTMVQIAAVSHSEDADALVAALRKRGYGVSVRNEPQDKLMHVQVGPFASHADAVTMRQKLLSDGYNAIIK